VNLRPSHPAGAVALLLFALSCESPAGRPAPVSTDGAAPAPQQAGDASSPVTPDTPAGRILRAYLDALNGGDEGAIRAFVTKYEFTKSAEQVMAFGRRTGGLELLGIDASEPLRVTFRVREKASPMTAAGALFVTGTEPTTVLWMTLLATPPGLTADDVLMKVDAAERGRVIDGVVAQLDDLYVYPELATKMEAALRAHRQHGDYDRVVMADWFASRLTDDLHDVSHDGHLVVYFTPKASPGNQPESKPGPAAEKPEEPKRVQCGFAKTERLDPGIGYVKLDRFADPASCAAEATAALSTLGDAGALVFDLRDNHGGSAEMVTFLASYLFDERTHLNDVYARKANTTTSAWTTPDVPGKKFPGVPVFLLTSKRTFSAAEGFSFALKNQKRVTIVGEATGGGAHLVQQKRIDDHFSMLVPYARALDPVTKADWEGTCVEPDVKVPADQALDVAKKMAAEAIAKRGKRVAAPR